MDELEQYNKVKEDLVEQIGVWLEKGIGPGAILVGMAKVFEGFVAVSGNPDDVKDLVQQALKLNVK